MIGKACLSTFPYYDRNRQKMSFKVRPVLIIGKADESDYVVLPISRIKRTEYIDLVYDFPLEISEYPAMKLTEKSYIRTHKQTVINAASVTKTITDFKTEYGDAYIDVLGRVENFQKQIIENAF